MLVSQNDSPEIKVRLPPLLNRVLNTSTLEDIRKGTLSSLTFAITNGSLHALFRSRFQSLGEILFIAEHMDRHRPLTFSGRKEEGERSLAITQFLELPCPAPRAQVLQGCIEQIHLQSKKKSDVSLAGCWWKGTPLSIIASGFLIYLSAHSVSAFLKC